MELYTPLILCAGNSACSLQSLLRNKGYCVIAAGDIEKALGLVGREGPDLILLDAAMSEGKKFCTELQKRVKTRVVLLAESEKEENRGFETVVDCLKKPIQPLVLLERIDSLLKDCSNESEDKESEEIAKRNAAILEKLKVLQKSYALQLSEKGKQVESDWKKLRETWEKSILEPLERMVHNLTGSGKTYGFPDISTTAREFEWWLKAFLAEGTEPDKSGLEHGDALCKSLIKVLDDAYRNAAITSVTQ